MTAYKRKSSFVICFYASPTLDTFKSRPQSNKKIDTLFGTKYLTQNNHLCINFGNIPENFF